MVLLAATIRRLNLTDLNGRAHILAHVYRQCGYKDGYSMSQQFHHIPRFFPSFNFIIFITLTLSLTRTLHGHFQGKNKDYLFLLFMSELWNFHGRPSSKPVLYNSYSKIGSQTSLKPIIVYGKILLCLGKNKAGFASESHWDRVKQNQVFLLGRQPIVFDTLFNIY